MKVLTMTLIEDPKHFDIKSFEDTIYSISKNDKYHPIKEIQVTVGTEMYCNMNCAFSKTLSGWRYITTESPSDNSNAVIVKAVSVTYQMPNGIKMHLREHKSEYFAEDQIVVTISRTNLKEEAIMISMKDLLEKDLITKEDYSKIEKFVKESIK